MKAKIMFVFLLYIIPHLGYSQNHCLKLSHKIKRHKVVDIEQNQYVKVTSKDGSVIRGNLSCIYKEQTTIDSMIIVGNDTICINEIWKIKTFPKAFRYAGVAFCFSGGALLFYSISLFPEGIIPAILGLFGSVVGAGALITGVIFSTIGKKYYADKWDISVTDHSAIP